MPKLYREVLVTERLPKEEGNVIGICDPADCLQQLYFENGQFFGLEDDNPMPVTAWLEPIELPSEEELKKERDSYSYSNISLLFNRGWRYGANYIINHLKGGKE